MENEIKELTQTFKEYRDMIIPIQTNLFDFVNSFTQIKDDLLKMDTLFEGDINGKLDTIYKTLASQAQKSTDLASKVSEFISKTDKFSSDITKLTNLFDQAEKKLTQINEIEQKAEAQIKKLDEIIEEKKINYNVKELQRSLETYNINVQKISDFINKDVIDKIKENSDKLNQVKRDNDELKTMVQTQSTDLNSLLETFKETNKLLNKTVMEENVNEEYIFDILDKWALQRKVKIKK